MEKGVKDNSVQVRIIYEEVSEVQDEYYAHGDEQYGHDSDCVWGVS